MNASLRPTTLATDSSVLRPASAEAAVQAEVAWVLIGGALLVFALVMGLLVHALRGRPRAVSERRWILGGGVLFPAVVLIALLVYGGLRGAELQPAQDPEGLVVAVVAHQWWWEVRYRDPASGGEVVLANEIRLPRGRRATLGLSTADVIHAFWAPELGGKLDMLPGRVQQLHLVPQRTGRYRGQCAEFCGTQHAHMALQVVVEEPADFERWLARQAQSAQPPADALARRGQAVFAEQRCGACHALRGVSAGSGRAPDLTHVGSRLTLGAGLLPVHEASLAAWVAGVQQLKPGARMPAYAALDGASLQALAAYLHGLQ